MREEREMGLAERDMGLPLPHERIFFNVRKKAFQ